MTHDAVVSFQPAGTASVRLSVVVGPNVLLFTTITLVWLPVMVDEKLVLPSWDAGFEVNENVADDEDVFAIVVFLIVRNPLFGVATQSVGAEFGCDDG